MNASFWESKRPLRVTEDRSFKHPIKKKGKITLLDYRNTILPKEIVKSTMDYTKNLDVYMDGITKFY